MRSRIEGVLAAAILCCGFDAVCRVAAAEGGPTVAITPRIAPHTADTPAVLRVDSSLVLIPVHVTNAAGASVNGLKGEDFRILEDGVEQTIVSCGIEDAPVSIGFLFDASASMRSKMNKSTEAAAAFFRTANREDEFFLVEFNDKARLMAPFTLHWDDIYERIVHTRPTGPTTLIDAMYLSLAQMKHARYARKALVILSDGGDNWSRHSARELERTLLESDVQVYALGIYDPEMHTSEEKNGPQLLERLTAETGGPHYRVGDLDGLPAISARMGRELRSQYLLGFYSTNGTQDGKYRRIQVKLAAPKSHELHLTYRRGYYAPGD